MVAMDLLEQDLYFLDYVEDIYIMVLSVLVSTLNLNHTIMMYVPLLFTVLYCTVHF